MPWLDSYIVWANSRTSAPVEYHEGVGLALLSTITQRRLVMRFSHKPLYANLWVCLLGLSGVSKKSTSIGFGRELLIRAAADLELSNDFSLEALIAELAKQPCGLFIRDEFSSFLETLKRDYSKGLKDILAGLYDCPERFKRTLRGETFELEDVYMTALVATTPKRFLQLLELNDWFSGFVARWCFILPQGELEFRPATYEETEARLERERLAQELAEMRQAFQNGEVTCRFTEAGLQCYNEYCWQLQTQLLDEPNAEELSASYARLEETAVKAAMLYQLSETLPQNGYLEIGDGALEDAIDWVEGLRENVVRLCAEYLGTETEGDKERVLRIIERNPGILWRRLLRSSHIGAGALRVILEELEHEGRINSEPEGKTTAYYPIR
ncbi:MAG: DUF3987 domain-containing protein [Chloroflexi bacterium]|nr:DUF3987 domain-containing protein [Chloroflexota bacterium]